MAAFVTGRVTPLFLPVAHLLDLFFLGGDDLAREFFDLFMFSILFREPGHIDGSLTTPPCSEGVSWQVMTTPITMSAEQIARFTVLYESDARPTQPLGDRELEVSD